MNTAELDMLQIILESGIVVKSVLASLILASLVSWAIVFKKRSLINSVEKNNEKFMELYKNSAKISEVYEKCKELPFSPYKSLFEHGYKELQKVKGSNKDEKNLKEHFSDFGLGVIERALKQGVNETNLELEKLLSTLASIGSITPFIGLFGTVWGIIDSFTGIAGGGATLDAVAPGIAEALIATAVGLAAAIPAVWFYNHYNSKNAKLNTDMESFGQEFLNVVERSLV
ncbi:MAG: protein TolQ [Halobacteriovorax sp.]|nr:protein TolQ [Halobacteriovorax sp.]|tara:strand:+ start:57710 stop:58396 length:687 start_codon:yes stop_codon:yes gene_type:complete